MFFCKTSCARNGSTNSPRCKFLYSILHGLGMHAIIYVCVRFIWPVKCNNVPHAVGITRSRYVPAWTIVALSPGTKTPHKICTRVLASFSLDISFSYGASSEGFILHFRVSANYWYCWLIARMPVTLSCKI